MSQLYGQFMQRVLLPLMLAPTRSQSTAIARRMRQRQRWPLERLQAYQLQHLQSLLAIADESPYYHAQFREAGVSVDAIRELDDLRRLPITTKNDIEANFPDGIVVASRRGPDWQYVGTGGTTRRIMVVHDFSQRDRLRGSEMFVLTEESPYCYGARQVSIPPDACSIHCGIESNRADSVMGQMVALGTRRIPWTRDSISDLRGLVMNNWVRRNEDFPPLLLDQDDTVRECVEAIQRCAPVQLLALPEYLRAISRYLDRQGIRLPSIRVVRPMGANLPRSWAPEIEKSIGATVREHYGCREVGALAFDCAVASGLHLLMDQQIMEILNAKGEPAQEGELGKVVITDLHNKAMPMIRYEIGDLARVTYDKCECGRTTPRIQLEGRIDDAIVTSDGHTLTTEAISNYFADRRDIEDFELTAQRSGKWSLRIVPAKKGEVSTEELSADFLAWAGDAPKLSIRTVSAIRPEGSGKYRHVKNETRRRFGEQEASE